MVRSHGIATSTFSHSIPMAKYFILTSFITRSVIHIPLAIEGVNLWCPRLLAVKRIDHLNGSGLQCFECLSLFDADVIGSSGEQQVIETVVVYHPRVGRVKGYWVSEFFATDPNN